MEQQYRIRCRKCGIITTAEPEKHDVVWKREFDPERSPIDRKTLKSNLINTEIMKVSKEFKQQIKDYLEKRAAEDELFAVTYKKENKNLEECCNYVVKCAQQGGCAGYSDEEVFGWAVHYYDEDDIKDVKPVNAKVIVNRSVELSESEKEEAKEKAMKQAVEDEKKKLVESGEIKLTEEDMADVKTKAVELATAEATKKMLEKKKPKTVKPAVSETAIEEKKEEQGTLF
ncbi:PcfK-like family protein [Flavobacterium sp. 25HG05S-40]|uniref:PcfK-like family protein n=1 Tax=Flavobacterium sp. 25HG05S-40 TaxID=3458682 RepID=UPI0040442AFF